MRSSALVHAPARAVLLLAAVLGAVLVIGGAEPAVAEQVGVPGPALVANARPGAGRFCTAASCKRSPASIWGAAASFGAAILLTRWLSRHSLTSA